MRPTFLRGVELPPEMARAKLITFSQTLICPRRRDGESDVKFLNEYFVTDVQLHMFNYVSKKPKLPLVPVIGVICLSEVVLPLFRARSAS